MLFNYFLDILKTGIIRNLVSVFWVGGVLKYFYAIECT